MRKTKTIFNLFETMSVPSVYTQIILCHFISEIQGFIL